MVVDLYQRPMEQDTQPQPAAQLPMPECLSKKRCKLSAPGSSWGCHISACQHVGAAAYGEQRRAACPSPLHALLPAVPLCRLRHALAESLSGQANGYGGGSRNKAEGALSSLDSPVTKAIKLFERMVLGGGTQVGELWGSHHTKGCQTMVSHRLVAWNLS